MNKLDKRKIKINQICLGRKTYFFFIFSFFLIYAIYSIIMQYSSAFPAEKFSIKHQLSLSLSHLNQSSPSQTDKDNLRQHNNYFVKTGNKEIKHQGDLLSRIQRSIQDYKSQINSHKDHQDKVNSSKNYFTASFSRPKHSRYKTLLPPTSPKGQKMQKERLINTASPSSRQILKIKASSLTTDFPQTQKNTRSLKRELSNLIFQTRPSTNDEPRKQKRQKQRRQANKPWNKNMKCLEMCVSGSKVQWQKFQSYTNKGAYLAKKYY